MYFDLSVPVIRSEEDALQFATRTLDLGWSCVAETTHYKGESLKRPSAAARVEDRGNASNSARSVSSEGSDLGYFEPGGSGMKENTRLLKLSRVNLIAAQIEDNTSLVSKCRRVYDLISCAPASEESFKKICTLVDCDIVSLDLSQPLPFRLHPGHVQTALKRGLVFEILYSKLLLDETTRMNVFSGAKSLCRSTRGRGIIISSGTRKLMDLRSPSDIINIAALFDLKGSQAKDSVCDTCRKLIHRVVISKQFHRGFCLKESVPYSSQEDTLGKHTDKRQRKT